MGYLLEDNLLFKDYYYRIIKGKDSQYRRCRVSKNITFTFEFIVENGEYIETKICGTNIVYNFISQIHLS